MSLSSLSIRASVIALCGLSLSLSLMSCSPISLSQSKLRSTPGTTLGVPADPITSNPTLVTPIGGSSTTHPGQSAASLTGVTASVRELSEYLVETRGLPSEQRLVLANDRNSEAFETFKTSRSLSIHFDGPAPDECKIYLGLAMSETMIANFGWNSSVHPILTDCVPQPGGNWKISISSTVSADLWAQLLPNLQAVTIFVAVHPRMTVVNNPTVQSNNPPAVTRPPVPSLHLAPSR